MSRATPNGAFQTIVGANRAALRATDGRGAYVIYHTHFGYGWAVVGSAAHADLLAGHDDGVPARIVKESEQPVIARLCGPAANCNALRCDGAAGPQCATCAELDELCTILWVRSFGARP